jgi:hypothetical protein
VFWDSQKFRFLVFSLFPFPASEPSTTASILPAMVSTRESNKDRHPGDILKKATKRRHTAKEIAEDNQRSKEAQEAQDKAAQHGIDRVGAIEALMEQEQAAAVSKVAPVKPKPRAKAVKKKQGTNDIPSNSCVVSEDKNSSESKGRLP